MVSTGDVAAAMSFEKKMGEDVMVTTQMFTYLDPKSLQKEVQSHHPDEFMDAFMQLADIYGVSVSVFDIERIIKIVLGEEVPRWIIEIFVVMSRNKSQFRRVKAVDFR